jgi:glycosyltransferase involved in cell wall biosynthesis
MQRALYFTDTYPPQVNGVSVVTALSVAGLRARGWDVAVVAPRYPAGMTDPFAADAKGARDDAVIAIPSLSLPVYPDVRLAAPALHTASSAVAAFRPSIVHCATEFVIGRIGQIAAARAGVPIVTSYHTDFGKYVTAYGVPWLRGTVASYLRRFHRRARRTFTPSGPAREDLRTMGVDDVEVWGRGVDLDLFNPSQRSTPLREACGVGDRFTFLYVGRLAPEKGVHHIIRAFARAADLLPADSIHLIVAGTGPDERALRDAAPRNVTFVGQLDRARTLPRLYASADAFVFASVTETLGLVVLEAMASGLPVIATPAGGVADHLRDDENGIAYPAGDTGRLAGAMVTLALHPGRARVLAAGARRTAERLGWGSELDRLAASYGEVLSAVAEVPVEGSRRVTVSRGLVHESSVTK